MQSIKLFVAYAPEDQPFRDRLSRHLSGLKDDGLIQQWDTSKVLAGQAADDAIQKHLAAADMVVLLVSADFLASEDCEKIEYQAFEYEKTKGTVIAPVIVRPCIFGEELQRLRLLPDQGKPVTDTNVWPDEDAAWANVAKGLKELVLQLQDGEGTDINQAKPPSPALQIWRRYGPLALATTYLIVAILGIRWLLQPKASVPATLDITTETFAFRYITSNSGPLLNSLPLESIDIADFDQTNLPAEAITLSPEEQPVKVNDQLIFRPQEVGAGLSIIPANLNELLLEKGVRLGFEQYDNDPPILGIRFSDAPVEVRLTTSDTASISAYSCTIAGLEGVLNQDIEEGTLYRDGGAITSNMAANQIMDLTLTFRDNGTVDNKQIFVDSIGFYKNNPDDPLALSSGIRSGTISITDWEEIQVASNYFLQLGVPQRLMLTYFECSDKGLRVKLNGRLEAISAGLTEEDQRNLIPSNIKWMLRNNLIALVLYGIAFLGFALFIFRFWRTEH